MASGGTRDFAALAAWHPRLSLDRVGTIWDTNGARLGPLGWLTAALPWCRTAIGSSVVRLHVAAHDG
ncbi:MAG: hypothetical protein ABI629_09590 [bacterium]